MYQMVRNQSLATVLLLRFFPLLNFHWNEYEKLCTHYDATLNVSSWSRHCRMFAAQQDGLVSSVFSLGVCQTRAMFYSVIPNLKDRLVLC